MAVPMLRFMKKIRGDRKLLSLECLNNGSLYFRNGNLPSRFFGKQEVEKQETNNTSGKAFSADRFMAKHLTMLGLFGVHLSIRRAKKKRKQKNIEV